MSIFNSITQGTTRGGTQIGSNVDKKKVSLTKDLAMAVPRGIEGALQGVYNLTDFAMGDNLPDYDTRFLGRSQTVAGGFAEGTVNFLTGFIPIAGQLGKVGQVARLAKAGQKSAKMAKKARKANVTKDVVAGAITDFTVFDGQEERLSNFVQNTPLANPLTDFLQANDDDNEVIGRFKNVAEGLFIEAGMRTLLSPFLSRADTLRKARKAKGSSDPQSEFAKLFDEFLADESSFELGLDQGMRDLQFNSFLDQKDFKGASMNNIINSWITSEKGQNSRYRPMFQALLNNNEFTLEGTKFMGFRKLEDNVKGVYNSEFRTVSLQERKISEQAIYEGSTEQTFLHEAVHAVTARHIDMVLGESSNFKVTSLKDIETKAESFAQYIKDINAKVADRDPSDAVRTLVDAYTDAVLDGRSIDFLNNPKELLDSISMRRRGGQDTYGLSSIHEFTAEAFSNPQFFKKLYGNQSKNKTLIQRVKDAIFDLLGIPNDYRVEFDDVVEGIRGVAFMTEVYTKDGNPAFTKIPLTKDKELNDLTDNIDRALHDGDIDEVFGSSNDFNDLVNTGKATADLQNEKYKKDPLLADKFGDGATGIENLKGSDLQDDLSTKTPDEQLDAELSTVKGIDEEAVLKDELPIKFEDDDIREGARKVDVSKIGKEKANRKVATPQEKAVNAKIDEIEKDIDKLVTAQYNLAIKALNLKQLPKPIADRIALLETKPEINPNLKRRYLQQTLSAIVNAPKVDADVKASVGKALLKIDTEYFDKFEKLMGQKLALKADTTTAGSERLLETRATDKQGFYKDDYVINTKTGKRVHRKDTGQYISKRGMAVMAENPNITLNELREGTWAYKAELSPDRGGDTFGVTDGTKVDELQDAQGYMLGKDNPLLKDLAKSAEKNARKREMQRLKNEYDLNDGEFDEFFGSGTSDLGEQIKELSEGKFKDEKDPIAKATSTALNNMLKGVSSTSGMLVAMRSLVDHLQKAPGALQKMEDINATNEALLDAFGGDKDTFEALMRVLKKSGKLDNFRAEQASIKMTMDSLAIRAQEKAIEIRDKGANVTDTDKIEFLESMDRLYEVGRLWNMYGREASLSLSGRRGLLKEGTALKEMHETVVGNDLNNRDVGTRTPSESGRVRYLKQKLGTRRFNELLQSVIDASDSKHLVNGEKLSPVIMAKLSKQIHGSRMLDMTLEYWTNSLLYGPQTQIVNILGNALTLAVRAGELTIGGLATFNMEQARSAMGALFHFDMIRESLRMAGKTWKDGAMLTQGSKVYDDDYVNVPKITARNVGDTFESLNLAESGTMTSSIINLFGAYSRIPGKALGVGDEFFKQMNYRYYARMKLSMEGLQKGLKGKELTKHVNDGFEGLLDQGRAYNQENLDLNYYNTNVAPLLKDKNFSIIKANKMMEDYRANRGDKEVDKSSDRSRLAEEALEFAKQNTFTSDLDEKSILGSASKFINKMKADPQLRGISFVLPFVRTPTNILKFALERTPLSRDVRSLGMDGVRALGRLVGVQKEFRSALNPMTKNVDPMVRSQAYGKVATSASLASVGYYYATQAIQLGTLTGAGPKDTDRRRALQQGGWQPYSIRVGDTYYSYNKFDPMSTVLGLYVDMAEAQFYQDIDQKDFEYMMGIVSLAFVNNVANKSFLQGVDNVMQLMTDPQAGATQLVGGTLAGFIPGYVAQSASLNAERDLLDARTVLDKILKRVPGGDVPGFNSLMPKRNALGEKVKIEGFGGLAGLTLPVYMRDVNKNVVDQEMARLNKGFSAPKSKLMNMFELRDIRNDKGITAYDRYQDLVSTTKIKGKTLRKYLEGLTKSRYYKRLNEGTDQELDLGVQPPRVKAIQKVINAYRRSARAELLKEFPELQDQVNELIRKRNLI
jgi:hypothetical protein